MQSLKFEASDNQPQIAVVEPDFAAQHSTEQKLELASFNQNAANDSEIHAASNSTPKNDFSARRKNLTNLWAANVRFSSFGYTYSDFPNEFSIKLDQENSNKRFGVDTIVSALKKLVVPITSSGKLSQEYSLNNVKPDLEEIQMRQEAINELLHDPELKGALDNVLNLASIVEGSQRLYCQEEELTPRPSWWRRTRDLLIGRPESYFYNEENIARLKEAVSELPQPASPLLKECFATLKENINHGVFTVVKKNLSSSEKQKLCKEVRDLQLKFDKHLDGSNIPKKRRSGTQNKFKSLLNSIETLPEIETERFLNTRAAALLTAKLAVSVIPTAAWIATAAITLVPSLLHTQEISLRIMGIILSWALSVAFTQGAAFAWEKNVPKRRKERFNAIESIFKYHPATPSFFAHIGILDHINSWATLKQTYPEETCIPNVGSNKCEEISAQEMISPIKYMRDGTYVPNDFKLSKKKPLLVTGHNSGGKTDLGQNFSSNQICAEDGGIAFAKEFNTFRSSGLTLFAPRQSELSDTHGRFGEELKAADATREAADEGSIIILDEVAQGTSEDEAAEVARDMLGAGAACGIFTMVITHNLRLARSLRNDQLIDTLQTSAYRDPKNRFKFSEGVAENSGARHVAAELGCDQDSLREKVAKKGGDLKLLDAWFNYKKSSGEDDVAQSG